MMTSANRTTTTTATKDLADALRALGLLRTAEDLSDFIARATRNRWSVTQILEQIAAVETEDRARRSVACPGCC